MTNVECSVSIHWLKFAIRISEFVDVADHFEPEAAFVGSFLDGFQLRDEVGFRVSTTR